MRIIGLLLLFYSAAGICGGSNSSKSPAGLSNKYQVSASQIFVNNQAKIDASKRSLRVSDFSTSNKGNYQYTTQVSTGTAMSFFQHIDHLYNSKGGSANNILELDRNEAAKLEVDVNFEQGNVLSENTTILRIVKSKSPRLLADGSLENKNSHTTYLVEYEYMGSGKHQMHVASNGYIGGRFNTDDLRVVFRRNGDKEEAFISVYEYTSEEVKATKPLPGDDKMPIPKSDPILEKQKKT
ncbi:hypothetical protein FLL45_20875 [Aliikangiella marina]|uniref:Uncharacterized protein n=1 Tax=Aliikangiella marina TaxID=1712262 RepID=A0A545T319_9GAMM|nr:hypothetical protein [Aliikangiella marina]TQV71606.1 hypothetical protein FLL45_20875 [Aliikangiella marina]